MGYELMVTIPSIVDEFKSYSTYSEVDTLKARTAVVVYCMQDHENVDKLINDLNMRLEMYKSVITLLWKYNINESFKKTKVFTFCGSSYDYEKNYFTSTLQYLSVISNVKVNYFDEHSNWGTKYSDIIEILEEFEENVYGELNKKFIDIYKNVDGAVTEESY